ncbi:hypothetical protein GCM10007907_15580 [Chitinimonas prasina]|uniref:Glycosyltransferase family 1 protein n=1 Tax=Chitinimonas prasina TaxID=1434937 RepID=A0ABQ5YFI7_9NEIS|nr:glycosyltransferase [Chitinimonas prasina]GLR12768.1 hypothetical protein GCM10007907_15580 [Chitinimonas prasina]
MTATFNIVLISPAGYRHPAAFAELAQILRQAITDAGYQADITYNQLRHDAINLVYGPHLLKPNDLPAVPPGTVFFQLEQIDANSPWYQQTLPHLIRHFEIWDYSSRNLQALAPQLEQAKRYLHMPLGGQPQRASTPAVEQDIDVLFYGSPMPRRDAIIQALQQQGLVARQYCNIYGPERDALIARAKLVLNLHSYDAKLFEIVRVAHLLAMGAAVVSETSSDQADYPGIDQAICIVPYEQLVASCIKLVADPAARMQLAQQGQAWLADHPPLPKLLPALQRLAADWQPAATSACPNRIKLGLNLAAHPGWLTIADSPAADIRHDPCQPLPLGQTFQTTRYGPVTLAQGLFQQIDTADYAMLCDDLPDFMAACARLLAADGEFRLNLPHELSGSAWRHPRTRRSFNEQNWGIWHDAHATLGWGDVALDLAECRITLSPLGQQLQHAGQPDDALLRTPRAVDRLEITLRRRWLAAIN